MSHPVPRPPGRVPAVPNPTWKGVAVVLAAWAIGPVLVVSAVSHPVLVTAVFVAGSVATLGRRLSRRGPTPSVGRTDDRPPIPAGGRRRRGGPDGGRS